MLRNQLLGTTVSAFADPAARWPFVSRNICFAEGDPPPPPPPNPNPPPPPPPPPAGETVEQRILRETREEAAHHRIAAKQAKEAHAAAQAELANAQTAQTTLRTELEGRATAAETIANRWKDRAIEAEIKAYATAAGIIDPDVVKLIPRTGITVADDGTITGVDTVVTSYKTAKPGFFRAAQPTSPPPPPPPPPRPGPGTPPAPNPNPGPVKLSAMPKQDFEAAKRAAISSLRGRH